MLGASVSLNGTPYTVIGVMPARFGYPYHADVWFPTTIPTERNGAGEWNVVARLRPGATLAGERAELRTIAAELAREVDSASAPTLLARPFDEEFNRDPDQVVMALLAGVALVLLIAGVNVSTLGLVRGAGRTRELAIRHALGASASAQIRLVLTESLLLSLVAGALGIALAWPLAGSLGALIPDRLSEVTPSIVVDSGAVLVAVLLSAGVGLVAGLPPALAATRSRGRSLVAGGRTGLTGGRRRALDGLVAAQVGLAMALLVAASALVRDFVGLMTRDLGYDRTDVLRVSMAFTNAGYEERAPRVRLVGSILDRVRALPGVGAAGAISLQPIPFTTSNVGRSVVVEGDRDPSSSAPILNYRAATPDYFGTLGIRLVNGRLFGEADRDGSVPVALLSRSAARRLFPAGDAIGHRIKLARRPDDPAPWVDVVGIVADIAEPNPTRPASVYVPIAQTAARDAPGSWSNSMTLLVRGHPLDAALIERVRQIVRQLDPDLPLYDVGTLATALEAPLADQRFGALLVLGFGAFALLMVALSTYGVVAFAVSGRLNEFGIRLALGAVPSTLRRQVVREAVVVVATGVGLGAGLALALAAPLSGALQEARVLDLTTWVGAGLVLLVAGGRPHSGPRAEPGGSLRSRCCGGSRSPKATRGAVGLPSSFQRTGRRIRSGYEILEPLAGFAFAQPLERPVAELTDPLASDSHHPADLLEGPAVAVLESKIEPEHLGIARRQRGQRRLDVLGLAVGQGRAVGALLVDGGKALHPLVAVAVPGGVIEPHRLRVESRQAPYRLGGQAGGPRELLGGGHPPETLLEERRGPSESAQVGRPVEGHPHGTAMARDRGLDRLADPPHCVRDELDPAIGVELSGRGHEAKVAFADQVDERHAPVLELLSHRHDEAHVMASQFFLRRHVSAERLARELHLLVAAQQRHPGNFVQVQVKALAALIHRTGDLGRTSRPALRTRKSHSEPPLS